MTQLTLKNVSYGFDTKSKISLKSKISSFSNLFKNNSSTHRKINQTNKKPEQLITAEKSENILVNDLSFSIPTGSMLGVIGESGCGKTTLLRIIAGFEKVKDGEIYFDNKLVTNKNGSIEPEKRKVGLVFQDYALFPHLNVYDNIIFSLTKKAAEDRQYWILESASRLGIIKLFKQFPYSLSGGEQQRVALLRAIVAKPKILLLDEPFSALNSSLRQKAREQTLSFIKEMGITTMLVTHDQDDIASLADYLLTLKRNENYIFKDL